MDMVSVDQLNGIDYTQGARSAPHSVDLRVPYPSRMSLSVWKGTSMHRKVIYGKTQTRTVKHAPSLRVMCLHRRSSGPSNTCPEACVTCCCYSISIICSLTGRRQKTVPWVPIWSTTTWHIGKGTWSSRFYSFSLLGIRRSLFNRHVYANSQGCAKSWFQPFKSNQIMTKSNQIMILDANFGAKSNQITKSNLNHDLKNDLKIWDEIQ